MENTKDVNQNSISYTVRGSNQVIKGDLSISPPPLPSSTSLPFIFSPSSLFPSPSLHFSLTSSSPSPETLHTMCAIIWLLIHHGLCWCSPITWYITFCSLYGYFFVLPGFFVFFGLGLIWAASPLYHNDFYFFFGFKF